MQGRFFCSAVCLSIFGIAFVCPSIEVFWVAAFSIVACMTYDNAGISKAVKKHIGSAVGRPSFWEPVNRVIPVSVAWAPAASVPFPALIGFADIDFAAKVLPGSRIPYNVAHQLSPSELVAGQILQDAASPK